MKVTNRIINSINTDIQSRNFDVNPLSYSYYLNFILLNHVQSAEKNDLLDWAENFSKDIIALKHRTKQIDDEITAAILIWKIFQIHKGKEITNIQAIKKVLSNHLRNSLYFDSLFHTIIIKYSLHELESFVNRDIIVKLVKNPKCLVFCQELPEKTKKGIIYQINEELQEDKLNVFDEFYYYWFLFRNKSLDKKNGFMLKINSYCEQWYLGEEDKIPALAKALLFDMSKRLNDGFYIVSETELEGKGITRFGVLIFLCVLGIYIFGYYLIYSNWSFVITEISKITLWQKIIIGIPLLLGINILFLVTLYSFFLDTILNSFPDKVIKSNLKKRMKKLYSILNFISWLRGQTN